MTTGERLAGPFKGYVEQWVQCVEFSPIKIFDTSTGSLLAEWNSHTSVVYSLAISRNGKFFVTGSWDNTVRLWDTATKQQLAPLVLAGHAGTIRSVRFLPDGKQVISGSEDMNVRAWRVEDGDEVGTVMKGDGMVMAVAASGDGRWIATAGAKKIITIWDATSHEKVVELEGHSGPVCSLGFSPDSARLVSGSTDGTVMIWNTTTGERLAGPLKGHTSKIDCVECSPNGEEIASSTGGMAKTTTIWDAMTHEKVVELGAHSGWVKSLAFSPDSARVVSGSGDGTVIVWSTTTGERLLGPLKGHTDRVDSVVFSPNGNQFASCSGDSTVRLWDATTLQQIGPALQHDQVYSVAISPDGHHLATTGGEEKTITIWNAMTYDKVIEWEGHSGLVWSLGFSSDSARLASGSKDGAVIVWDTTTGERLPGPLNGHTHWVRSVEFSPNGRQLIAGCWDGSIRFFDASTGSPLAKLKSHTEVVESITVSRNGKFFASGSGDGTVRLWDTTTRQQIGPALQQDSYIFSVAISPDGSHLASGGLEKELRIWSLTGIIPQSVLANTLTASSDAVGPRVPPNNFY
ncbi:hypothetical protein PAXINDRAFT_81826 [Paxillus involutus ATCC 200175]|uniref:WD40 repeat-like protein n=1 Tax=Paxillus involutus ATCC 200175 TaxID=664439 RepID=A0A0C9TC03_PAXIN|nr:hypothetical protein PAXINDRAFT_81826 [Paxillus involutus ATCC 200175]